MRAAPELAVERVDRFFPNRHFSPEGGFQTSGEVAASSPHQVSNPDESRRSSVAVFLLWCRAHKGCQLSFRQNFSWSPLCGSMWSTTVARTSLPSLAHITHHGFSYRNQSRSCLHRCV